MMPSLSASAATLVAQSGVVPMRASKIVENYRRSGYTLPDCKNEEDDNSLDAAARRILLRLLSNPDDPDTLLDIWEHIDDGHGMTRDQIIEHLEIGGAPHGDRVHGMAHTGAKTSSWNIGHEMIVASKVVGGATHCIKMSTRPLETGAEDLRWEEVSYEREISAATRAIFDTFPSGTIVCVKDILEKNKLPVADVAKQLEKGTKAAYNRVPEGCSFTIQVNGEVPVVVALADTFCETPENAADLDNVVDAVLEVYTKHGETYVMLKSTRPILKGMTSVPQYTLGTPERPVRYNITSTMKTNAARAGGRPIQWEEELEVSTYTLVGEIETRAINRKIYDGGKPGYHIQRNYRHLGLDNIEHGDHPTYKRMRLRLNYGPALDSLFGTQFNKKNTVGIENRAIKAAIDNYWTIITRPWIKEDKRRAAAAKAALDPPVVVRQSLGPVVANGGRVSLPASSRRTSVTESTSSDVEVTDDEGSSGPLSTEHIPVPGNPHIAWIRAHEADLRTPEVLAELCRLLNLCPTP